MAAMNAVARGVVGDVASTWGFERLNCISCVFTAVAWHCEKS